MSKKKIPQHIAIIMDGNGRWAKKRNLPRFKGHLEGVKRVEEIIQAASDFDIKVLTLYTFSTENWRRPRREVSMLMDTICSVLEKKAKTLLKGNIKLHFVGREEGIPVKVMQSLDRSMQLTKNNTGLILNLAFNYGSRIEIIDAVKNLCRAVKKKEIEVDDINERMFSDALYTRDLPDPDLLIRTSGEQRISNFLLWQLSYAELYFTDKYWPEFNKNELQKAIEDYQARERRYGKTAAQK